MASTGLSGSFHQRLRLLTVMLNLNNFTLALLTIFIIAGCGIVQTSSWVSFTDNLGTGSEVQPTEALFNWRGDVEVRLTKAADPQWMPSTTVKYPYAGILMQLKRSGGSVDISAATGLAIEYRLIGRVSLILKQKNIDAGKEYRVDLSPQEEFRVASYQWDNFEQPPWVNSPTRLDLSQIIGISFMNSSTDQSTAHLSVRKIVFPGI